MRSHLGVALNGPLNKCVIFAATKYMAFVELEICPLSDIHFRSQKVVLVKSNPINLYFRH